MSAMCSSALKMVALRAIVLSYIHQFIHREGRKGRQGKINACIPHSLGEIRRPCLSPSFASLASLAVQLRFPILLTLVQASRAGTVSERGRRVHSGLAITPLPVK